MSAATEYKAAPRAISLNNLQRLSWPWPISPFTLPLANITFTLPRQTTKIGQPSHHICIQGSSACRAAHLCLSSSHSELLKNAPHGLLPRPQRPSLAERGNTAMCCMSNFAGCAMLTSLSRPCKIRVYQATAAISGSSWEAVTCCMARWLADTNAISLFSADTYARALATTTSSLAPLPEKLLCVEPPCGRLLPAYRQKFAHPHVQGSVPV